VCRRPPIRRRRTCLRFSLMTSGTELQHQDAITMSRSHTTPSHCLVAFLIPLILCSICTVVTMLTRLVSSPAITACDWVGFMPLLSYVGLSYIDLLSMLENQSIRISRVSCFVASQIYSLASTLVHPSTRTLRSKPFIRTERQTLKFPSLVLN
jgi:hypothetical protein